MPATWTTEQIIALAPDASSAKNGQALVDTSNWVSLGENEQAVWGECQGSKHGLGLFLLKLSQPTLPALNDDGAPVYEHSVAEQFAELGIPAFACTPDQFPDLIAAAISRQDIRMWAAANEIVTTRSQRN